MISFCIYVCKRLQKWNVLLCNKPTFLTQTPIFNSKFKREKLKLVAIKHLSNDAKILKQHVQVLISILKLVYLKINVTCFIRTL